MHMYRAITCDCAYKQTSVCACVCQYVHFNAQEACCIFYFEKNDDLLGH